MNRAREMLFISVVRLLFMIRCRVENSLWRKKGGQERACSFIYDRKEWYVHREQKISG